MSVENESGSPDPALPPPGTVPQALESGDQDTMFPWPREEAISCSSHCPEVDWAWGENGAPDWAPSAETLQPEHWKQPRVQCSPVRALPMVMAQRWYLGIDSASAPYSSGHESSRWHWPWPVVTL